MQGTTFSEFVALLNEDLKVTAGAPESASRVRDRLRSALAGSLTFAMDCVERVLETMEREPPAAWRSPPIHDDDEHRYMVRLCYWPVGFENNPHRHDDWTVTGVLHNELRFRTFREESTGLAEEKRMDCAAGDVGYINTPCIHNVANVSTQESISIHVFSGARMLGPNRVDHNESRGRTAWYTRSASGDVSAGSRVGRGIDFTHTRTAALRTFVAFASAAKNERTISVLDRVFDLGGPPEKLASVKAMASVNSRRAARKLRELAPLCPPSVARDLERMGDDLMRGSASE